MGRVMFVTRPAPSSARAATSCPGTLQFRVMLDLTRAAEPESMSMRYPAWIRIKDVDEATGETHHHPPAPLIPQGASQVPGLVIRSVTLITRPEGDLSINLPVNRAPSPTG